MAGHFVISTNDGQIIRIQYPFEQSLRLISNNILFDVAQKYRTYNLAKDIWPHLATCGAERHRLILLMGEEPEKLFTESYPIVTNGIDGDDVGFRSPKFTLEFIDPPYVGDDILADQFNTIRRYKMTIETLDTLHKLMPNIRTLVFGQRFQSPTAIALIIHALTLWRDTLEEVTLLLRYTTRHCTCAHRRTVCHCMSGMAAQSAAFRALLHHLNHAPSMPRLYQLSIHLFANRFVALNCESLDLRFITQLERFTLTSADAALPFICAIRHFVRQSSNRLSLSGNGGGGGGGDRRHRRRPLSRIQFGPWQVFRSPSDNDPSVYGPWQDVSNGLPLWYIIDDRNEIIQQTSPLLHWINSDDDEFWQFWQWFYVKTASGEDTPSSPSSILSSSSSESSLVSSLSSLSTTSTSLSLLVSSSSSSSLSSSTDDDNSSSGNSSGSTDYESYPQIVAYQRNRSPPPSCYRKDYLTLNWLEAFRKQWYAKHLITLDDYTSSSNIINIGIGIGTDHDGNQHQASPIIKHYTQAGRRYNFGVPLNIWHQLFGDELTTIGDTSIYTTISIYSTSGYTSENETSSSSSTSTSSSAAASAPRFLPHYWRAVFTKRFRLLRELALESGPAKKLNPVLKFIEH